MIEAGGGAPERSPPETHWPAPAKLNLFLHLTGRRVDGYHELQTLFQLIDLADTLCVSVRADGEIDRPAGPPGVPPEADLVVRAARTLKAATGTALGASLRVRKRIPMRNTGSRSSELINRRLHATPKHKLAGIQRGALEEPPVSPWRITSAPPGAWR